MGNQTRDGVSGCMCVLGITEKVRRYRYLRRDNLFGFPELHAIFFPFVLAVARCLFSHAW